MTYEDLLAARLLHKAKPELTGGIMDVLSELEREPRRGGLGFRTLLSELLRRGLVSREQATYVFERVTRLRQGRALGVYVELLIKEGGAPRDLVEATLRSLGLKADVARLERALSESGQLDQELSARLRYLSKVALDRDEAEQLETFALRRAAESAQTLVAGESDALATGVAGDKIPSGVYRDELVIPTAAESTNILDRASLGFVLRAPRFPVPDWVDTSDPLTGVAVGEFRVLGLVGQGAMAKVYLADHATIEHPVALKLLPLGASRERQERFRREILANSFFQHDNAIDIYDAGQTEKGRYYLAMEFFDGTDLEQVLEEQGTLALTQSLGLTIQLLNALEVAHSAGIVHRDLKPGNIMVDSTGSVAKVTDFGIALIKELGDFKDKVFESDDGGITGTPEYLSPEQAFRDPLGPPSDLYSLGFVLYRMLSGRLPFEAETVPGWVNCHIAEDPLPLDQAAPERDWPPRLLKVFERLLVKEPKKRYQSSAEVRAELEAILLDIGSSRNTRPFNRVRGGF